MFEPLADFIRLRRKQMGMTQEKLARLAKVSRRQLSLLEDGHNVSLLFLTKVAKVLELTDIPVGNLRVFAAPPDLGAAIRTAEVVENLREAFETWGASAQIVRSASTVLNELVAQALVPPPASTALSDEEVATLAPPPAADPAESPSGSDEGSVERNGR